MQTSDQIQRLSYHRFLATVHYHSDRDEIADGPRLPDLRNRLESGRVASGPNLRLILCQRKVHGRVVRVLLPRPNCPCFFCNRFTARCGRDSVCYNDRHLLPQQSSSFLVALSYKTTIATLFTGSGSQCRERCLAKPVFLVFSVLTFLYCKNIRKNLVLYYSMFQYIQRKCRANLYQTQNTVFLNSVTRPNFCYMCVMLSTIYFN